MTFFINPLKIARLNSKGFTNLQLSSLKCSAFTAINMAIFRQYVAPFLVLLVFLVALLAVSARIFLPSDMAAPAPIEDVESVRVQLPKNDAASGLPTLDEPTLPTSAGSLVN
jgi:hypothetical protein